MTILQYGLRPSRYSPLRTGNWVPRYRSQNAFIRKLLYGRNRPALSEKCGLWSRPLVWPRGTEAASTAELAACGRGEHRRWDAEPIPKSTQSMPRRRPRHRAGSALHAFLRRRIARSLYRIRKRPVLVRGWSVDGAVRNVLPKKSSSRNRQRCRTRPRRPRGRSSIRSI